MRLPTRPCSSLAPQWRRRGRAHSVEATASAREDTPALLAFPAPGQAGPDRVGQVGFGRVVQEMILWRGQGRDDVDTSRHTDTPVLVECSPPRPLLLLFPLLFLFFSFHFFLSFFFCYRPTGSFPKDLESLHCQN